MSRNRNKEEKKVIDATVIDEAILTYVLLIKIEKPSKIIWIKIKSSPKTTSISAKSKYFHSLSSVIFMLNKTSGKFSILSPFPAWKSYSSTITSSKKFKTSDIWQISSGSTYLLTTLKTSRALTTL